MPDIAPRHALVSSLKEMNEQQWLKLALIAKIIHKNMYCLTHINCLKD